MAGKKSAAPANDMALTSMMKDLGNHRIEELARDDGRNPRHELTPLPSISVANTSYQPRNRGENANELSKMYHAAIKEGAFDDDDAAGVSGLDPLDDGNAHRIGRALDQQSAPSHFNAARSSKQPMYDPSQPTYRRGKPKRPIAPGGQHQVSSLGGIVPVGGKVRKWVAGKPTNAALQNKTNLGSPTAQGQPKARQTTVTNAPPLAGISAGGLRQPQPAPLPRVNATSSVSQKVSNTGGHRIEAGSSSNLKTEFVPPHLRIETKSQPIASHEPAISPQALFEPSQIKADTAILDGNNEADTRWNSDASEVFLTMNTLIRSPDSEPVSGKIILYEALEAPVGIWELLFNDTKVSRGDIRELLEPLRNGSSVYLRRYSGTGPVRSNHLQFQGIGEAQSFVNEANLRRGQYSGSLEAIRKETDILFPAKDVTNHEMPIELVKASVHGPSTSIHGLPQSEERKPATSSLEQPKVVKSTRDNGSNEKECRPSTPPMTLPSNNAETTQAMTMCSKSGGLESENGGDDLLYFSPVSANKSSQIKNLVNSDHTQPATIRGHVSTEIEKLAELPYEKVGPQAKRTVPKGSREGAAETTVRVLRDMKIDNKSSFTNNQRGISKFFGGVVVDYEAVARTSTLLTIALENSPTPHPNPVLIASLLYLAENNKFLDLPHYAQKSCVTNLYHMVRTRNSRIIRHAEEILALRTGKEAGPQALVEVNALIRDQNKGRSSDKTQTLPSLIYDPVATSERMETHYAFLYGRSTDDSLNQNDTQGVDNVTSLFASKTAEPSESSGMSDQQMKGLPYPHWAENQPGDKNKQITGREVGVNGTIKQKANGRPQSPASDRMMTMLTGQLNSLSFKGNGTW